MMLANEVDSRNPRFTDSFQEEGVMEEVVLDE